MLGKEPDAPQKFPLQVRGLSGPFFAFGRAAPQQLHAARILASEGKVEIRRATAGATQPQKIGFKSEARLQAGDTIITGKKGRLVLGISDGSQAVVGAQTTVVLADLSQSPRTLFQVVRGKTRIHIEKLGGQPNPYRVNTPPAVIAVRGTTFEVLVRQSETRVFVHEGQVAVTSLALPNQPVILFGGQRTPMRAATGPAGEVLGIDRRTLYRYLEPVGRDSTPSA